MTDELYELRLAYAISKGLDEDTDAHEWAEDPAAPPITQSYLDNLRERAEYNASQGPYYDHLITSTIRKQGYWSP
jgi:hypothetical protein